MEDLLEEPDVNSILTAISNSSKFKLLCKTIYALRNKYLLRGLRHEQINQKIMTKIFNTKNPLTVNWLNLKNTNDFHKIRTLLEIDPKTIETAIAIHQELEKMRKKRKNDKITIDYTLDDMLDVFQYRLDLNFTDKNSSSSSSDSTSDADSTFKSPELPFFHHDYSYDNHTNTSKEVSNSKRKISKKLTYEEDIRNKIKEDLKKKIKFNKQASENYENPHDGIPFIENSLFGDPIKRSRDSDSMLSIDKTKLYKF